MKPFSIKKIKENIYLIKEVFYQESSNIYLFQHKNECLLFDCGLGFFNLKKFLLSLGYTSFTVVITHSHFDHVGGINYFDDKEVLFTQQQSNSLMNMNNLGLKYLKSGDFSGLNSNKVSDFCGNFYIKNKTPFLFLNNELNFFNYKFKVVKTPGHTHDSICFYEPDKNILITGDTLYDGELYYDFIDSSIEKFKDSLNGLLEFDAKLVLTGHNQVLKRKEMQTIVKKSYNKLDKCTSSVE